MQKTLCNMVLAIACLWTAGAPAAQADDDVTSILAGMRSDTPKRSSAQPKKSPNIAQDKVVRQQNRVLSRTESEVDQATDKAVDESMDRVFDKVFGK